MNVIEGILLVLLIFPATCLAGYAIAGMLATPTAGVRLCLASLAGLGLWLWLLAVVNVFLAINFRVAWSIIGGSTAATLLLPYARRALTSDVRAVFSIPQCGWIVFAPLPLIAGLLLPMWFHPGLMFYDGTSNHDSFFWITGAEWLQRHNYLTSPAPGIDPAYYTLTHAFTGISPVWARMGSEGLLALFASAFGVLPLEVYVYAQVGLLPVWLAGVVVFTRFFLATRLPVWVFCLGASLQPVFVFFATNNNLPNLLGALVAPVLLAAFVRLTAPEGLTRFERTGWGVLAAVLLHGLLCAYPEMAPFALFAAGGAVVAKLCKTDRKGRRVQLITGVVLAGIAGLLIQPLTTWRLYSGLWNSFFQARADSNWGNLFTPLDASAYFPALTTLNIPACKELGPALSWLLTGMLVVMLIAVLRRAHDRASAIAGLSGAVLLIGYTLATDFSYGWQKAAQFSGVIVAGIFTMGSYAAMAPFPGMRHGLLRCAAVAVIASLMAYTAIWGCARSFYWSENKALDADFFSMRALSHGELRHQPVEVVGSTFGRSFFYSMWAVYALPESPLTFDPRGEQVGGYLSGHLPRQAAAGANQPRAYLVSRTWADTFDLGATRLSSGPHHALVTHTTKVVAQDGVFPAEGVPQEAKGKFSLTLLPYTDCVLEMDIALQPTDQRGASPLFFSYGEPGRTESWQTGKAEYPWLLRVPMRGGVECQIKVETNISGREEYPLRFSALRLVRR